MLELIKSGGVLIWPLLLCSVISLAIICERFWSLQKATHYPPEDLVKTVWEWNKRRDPGWTPYPNR